MAQPFFYVEPQNLQHCGYLAVICSQAATEFFVDGIYYSYASSTSTTCQVVYKSGITPSMYKGDIVIPETVTYNNKTYTVTELGSYAFRDCIGLESLSLPSTITKMSSDCFQNCVLLKSIKIPDQCEDIPSYCFEGCSSLSDVNLNKVKTIGYYAFIGCPSLRNLVIPKSVSSISEIFNSSSSLDVITIEDGSDELTVDFDYWTVDSIYVGRNIKDMSSRSYMAVRSIHFSDNVTKIPAYMSAPYSATWSKLEKVSGMKNVQSIGNYAFYGSTLLKNFVIGNNVTTLGNYIFSGCTQLETLVVGDGIEKLDGKYLVYGCTNLKTIYLGKGLKSLGSYSFGSSITPDKVFIFSDVLSSLNASYSLPKTTGAVYVANPERYETLLSGYNVKSLLTFQEASLEYTGKSPELTYKNNVEGMDVSFDSSTTPKDAGSYNTELDVTFSMPDWQTTVQIPCAYTVTKAPLSIMTNNAQRYYGEDNPELTCEYVGFKNGETAEVLDAQPTVYTTATKDSYVGTYPIYCTGAEAKNYTITTQNGTLTIIKAPQTITWEQDFTGVHVGDQIELTATASSGLNVKYRSSDQTAALITTQNGKQYAYILKEGIAAITAYQSGDTNHEEADEVTLLVNATSGISGIQADSDPNATYYNTSGQRVSQPNGLTIVRQADGTTRKVVVK